MHRQKLMLTVWLTSLAFGSCLFVCEAKLGARDHESGQATEQKKKDNVPDNQRPLEAEKPGKEGLLQELKTPQGEVVRLPNEHDPWADAVVSFKRGNPDPKKNRNPWLAMGKPAGHSYAIGHGGTLIVEFVDNVLVDGPGPDLVIFEVGKAIEPTRLAISENGTDWIDIGRVAGSKSTIDIAPFVKPNQQFRFVRLTDTKSGKSKGSSTVGADINGVGALNSLPVLKAPSRKEIESRWKR